MPNPALTPSILQALLAGMSRTLARGEGQDPETAAALLEAFHPGTPIQAMLAAQAVALHHAAIDCFGRAMQTDPEEHTTAARLQRNAASLTRAFTATLHTLQRCQIAAAQAAETGQQNLLQREDAAPPCPPPAPGLPDPRQNRWENPLQRERLTRQARSEQMPRSGDDQPARRAWEQLTDAEQFAILYPERVAAGATGHEDIDLWLPQPNEPAAPARSAR
jgi:hypothetical protein